MSNRHVLFNFEINNMTFFSYTGHNNPLYRREEEHVEGHPGYLFNVWDTIKVLNHGTKQL